MTTYHVPNGPRINFTSVHRYTKCRTLPASLQANPCDPLDTLPPLNLQTLLIPLHCQLLRRLQSRGGPHHHQGHLPRMALSGHNNLRPLSRLLHQPNRRRLNALLSSPSVTKPKWSPSRNTWRRKIRSWTRRSRRRRSAKTKSKSWRRRWRSRMRTPGSCRV